MDIIWKSEKDRIEAEFGREVPFLYFPCLKKTGLVNHGFSTRLGGVSKGDMSKLNLGFKREDDRENVLENYRRITRAIGVEMDSLVLSDQVHKTNIRIVTEEDRGKGISRARDYEEVDGFITNCRGITLTTFYADCVPLFFLDPQKRAIGLVHSGWRGTVKKIGEKAIKMMGKEFGTRENDLIACIGPSICKDCYEVSQDVVEEFKREFSPRDWNKIFTGKENGKYQLDLWKANEIILEEAGILKENIHVSHLCTCCNPKFLFSHRASKGRRGNLAAFLELKERT
jgi:YfiH family protein